MSNPSQGDGCMIFPLMAILAAGLACLLVKYRGRMQP